MAESTKIEWTDSTFNPWWGCTKIAPACDNCYAAALDKRTGGNHWGNEPRRRTSESNWQQPLKWQRQAASFFAQHGGARRVFSASMADIFDNQVDPSWRADFWDLVRRCPDLDWQLLTKRPQNIADMLPAFWDEIKGHVWLGTTVEDQKHFDLNVPHLLQHDCAVRFLSCEPLLGEISSPLFRLDWIIAGGESGPGARPTNPAWFRELRAMAEFAAVPFFFKQWGDWGRLADVIAYSGRDNPHLMAAQIAVGKGDTSRYIADASMGGDDLVRLPKTVTGSLLDGVEHKAFPNTMTGALAL